MDEFEADIIAKKVFNSSEALRDGLIDFINQYGGNVTFYVRKSKFKLSGTQIENTLYMLFVIRNLIEDSR